MIRLSLFLFAWSLNCPFASAYVVTTSASSGPGSLEEALIAPGGTITFDPSLAGAVIETSGQTRYVRGPLTIDASSLASPVTLRGINLEGGDYALGGVFVPATMVFRNLRFQQTTQLRANTSRIELHDCVFDHTSGRMPAVLLSDAGAPDGFGMQFGQSEVLVERCVFEGVTRTLTPIIASAISIGEGNKAVIRDSAFIANEGFYAAIFMGGGVSNPELLVEGCVFSGHDAPPVFISAAANGSPHIIRNSLFHNNRQVIDNRNAFLRFENCTIARNRSNAFTPAIATTLPITFSHTILAENGEVPGAAFHYPQGVGLVSEGHNIVDADLPAFNGPGDMTRTDPRLAPPGAYGGNSMSMPPLAGSPAIDAGDPSLPVSSSTDQRGLPRVVDGRGTGVARIDIGAAEAGPAFTVDHALDENDGAPPWSLREAVGLAPANSRIVFAPSLDGAVIRLGAGQGGLGTPLLIDRDLSIDATGLLRGIELRGGNQTRLANIAMGVQTSFHAVTFRNGFAANDGGGLSVRGKATLHACTLMHNTVGGRGGAIHLNGGELIAENLTLAGNHANSSGGAIADNPDLPSEAVFHFTTIYDNTADGGGTGGLQLGNTRAAFRYSIVANNRNATGTRNLNTLPASSVTSLGYNLSDTVNMGFSEASDRLTTQHGLNPVADNGGWVPTCAIHPVNSTTLATMSLATVPDVFVNHSVLDARGFVRGVSFRRGAFQPGGDSVDTDGDLLPDWWERFYGFDWLIDDNAGEDPDGDNLSNLVEYQSGTDPRVFDATTTPNALLEIISVEKTETPGSLEITFRSQPGQSYTIQYSPDLTDPWDDLNEITASGTQTTVTATVPAHLQGGTRAFFRIRRP